MTIYVMEQEVRQLDGAWTDVLLPESFAQGCVMYRKLGERLGEGS